MLRKTVFLGITSICISGGAHAACPTPIPQSMSGGQLRECLVEMQKDFKALKLAVKSSVPNGAVIAFNGKCPQGWKEESLALGRVIVGANPNQVNGLSERKLGQSGGEESVVLAIPNMPSHQHATTQPSLIQADGFNKARTPWGKSGQKPTSFGAPFDFATNTNGPLTAEYPLSSAAGGGKDGKAAAHNNMPPFVVFNFCKRS